MKERTKGRRRVAVTVISVAVVLLGLVVFFNLPKPLKTLDSEYDLSQMADGVYAGKCDNGIVRVQVEVTVKNHAIADILITQHQNGLGGKAEAIVGTVLQRQSVEVDAVSSATMSSRTILKAVENALSEGTEEQK